MLFVSLEHIEVFLVIFSETSETGHEGPWVIWRGMTQQHILGLTQTDLFKSCGVHDKLHVFT